MRKTVLTFGLIAGGMLSLVLAVTYPFHDQIGFDKGLYVGYTSMVAAFLLTYFGIRSYRDVVGNGTVGFGRALTIGALITVVASACYVATWETIYFGFGSGRDYLAKYSEYMAQKEKAKGTSQAEIDKKVTEMKQFAETYNNPVVNSAVTFLEPLPVGLLIALVSAFALSRKRRQATTA